MILAGDIGGTKTRLAAFETDGNRLNCVVEKIYPSKEHAGLNEIVADFVKTEGIPAHSACFGVAGPVQAGRSKISNLPWIIDSRELAAQLRLSSVGLFSVLALCEADLPCRLFDAFGSVTSAPALRSSGCLLYTSDAADEEDS